MSQEFVDASAALDTLVSEQAKVRADVTKIAADLAAALAGVGGMTVDEGNTIVSRLKDAVATEQSIDDMTPDA